MIGRLRLNPWPAWFIIGVAITVGGCGEGEGLLPLFETEEQRPTARSTAATKSIQSPDEAHEEIIPEGLFE